MNQTNRAGVVPVRTVPKAGVAPATRRQLQYKVRTTIHHPLALQMPLVARVPSFRSNNYST